MNLTQILAVDFGSVLLNVLAIIGIIVAGGFLIFFLGDLLLSILDPENCALKAKKKEDKTEQTGNAYLPYQEQQKIQENDQQEYLGYNNYKPEEEKYVEVDMNKAQEEKNLINQDAVETEPVEEKVEEPAMEVVEEKPEDSFAKLRAEEEAYRQKKLSEATEKQDVFAETKKEEDEDYNFDDIFNDDFDFDDIDFDEDENESEVEEENKEEPVVEEVEEEAPVENLEDIKSEINEKNKENEDLKAELERKIAELEELKAKSEEEKQQIAKEKEEAEQEKERLSKQNEELEQMLKKIEEEKPVETDKPQLSLEEYEERLATLQERLKINEKELRAIKKEYLPLMRVRKNLENDKKKLRRREALVAKQKVVLYGVNNISDIDDERAKKLTEDLDLLDGLRLSVQHCEEVIKNSEERYPILETSYRILNTTVQEIKSDIEEVEANIAKLKEEENNSDND